MLNDTRLNQNTEFNLPGFSIIRTDKNTNDSSAGGTAIAIPSSWDAEIISNISEAGNGYESTGIITLAPNCKPLKLLSIYNHPQKHIPEHLLENFIRTKHNNQYISGLIAGDLNCPHEAFSSRFSNIYGTNLLNVINNLDLMVLDNEEPTTYHRGEPNILDLILCEPRSFPIVQECFVGESVGSDHLPLIAHVILNSTISPNVAHSKKILNTEKFNEEVKQHMLSFDANCSNLQEVDQKIEEITSMLKNLQEKNTEEKRFRYKRLNLPPELLEWIKIRKMLLKHLKKANDIAERTDLSKLYNRANKIVKDQLNQFDRNRKAETVEKMQSAKNTSKMWHLYKGLKNDLEPKNSLKRPLINPNGEKVFDSESKAELFADRLESIHQTPTGAQFDQNFHDEVSNFIATNDQIFSPISSSEPLETHDMLHSIDASQVEAVIRESKKGSSPGGDGISYDLLKKCPSILFLKLAIIYNVCLNIGYFPKSWKEAKITMLQKPGKDHSDPKGYRPISLLPVLGKVFEKILCQRLTSFLEQNKLISKYQAGYQKGRSTQEHILRLSQQVFNGFKEQKCTIAVFLDVEAAFDAVWTDGLLYKLHQLNIPSAFLRVLSSFLTQRKLEVHEGNNKSRPVHLKAGTPQGSCLSPILFSIFVNDIPFNQMDNCSPSQFADDTCIWSTNSSTIIAADSVQKALKKLEEWCSKWRVKLSPSKTKVLLFSKCPKAHQTKPPLVLFGEHLSYSDEATFLGVKFNASLTWEPQIRSLIAKAQPRINLLRAMSSFNRTGEVDMLLSLYKAIVRPIFEYSAIAHINAATCHHLKLQRLQNAAIRHILKLPRYLSVDILHDASGLPMLHDHLITFGKKRLSSLKEKSPLIPDVIDQFNRISHITKWKSPLEYLL